MELHHDFGGLGGDDFLDGLSGGGGVDGERGIVGVFAEDLVTGGFAAACGFLPFLLEFAGGLFLAGFLACPPSDPTEENLGLIPASAESDREARLEGC